jgi:hypothetical protein
LNTGGGEDAALLGLAFQVITHLVVEFLFYLTAME